jgi:hypothetical protein
MSTDRELLELAAKAAGFYVKSEVVNQDDDFIGLRVKPGISAPRVTIAFWNALTDDGDALRLAVKLEMDIFFNDGDTDVLGVSEGGGDPFERTRRAIVRAAAEIGRGLP